MSCKFTSSLCHQHPKNKRKKFCRHNKQNSFKSTQKEESCGSQALGKMGLVGEAKSCDVPNHPHKHRREEEASPGGSEKGDGADMESLMPPALGYVGLRGTLAALGGTVLGGQWWMIYTKEPG